MAAARCCCCYRHVFRSYSIFVVDCFPFCGIKLCAVFFLSLCLLLQLQYIARVSKKRQFHIIARWEISAMPHVAVSFFFLLLVPLNISAIYGGIWEIIPHSKWFDLIDLISAANTTARESGKDEEKEKYIGRFLFQANHTRYEFWMRRHHHAIDSSHKTWIYQKHSASYSRQSTSLYRSS